MLIQLLLYLDLQNGVGVPFGNTIGMACYICEHPYIPVLWNPVPSHNPVPYPYIHVQFLVISMHNLCDPAIWLCSLPLPCHLSVTALFIGEPHMQLNPSPLLCPASQASLSSPILHHMISFHLQITFGNTYLKYYKSLHSIFIFSVLLFHIINEVSKPVIY